MNKFLTFHVSPLALMPLRFWCVMLEIKRLTRSVARKNIIVQERFWKELTSKAIDLRNRVEILCIHFGLTCAPFYGRGFDPVPSNKVALLFFHYKLTLELRHYQRLLRREERQRRHISNKADRLMPSWIQVEKASKRAGDYFDKVDWKIAWKDKFISSDGLGNPSYMVDDMAFAYVSAVLLAVVLAFYLYFMVSKDQILFSLANKMVVESLKRGMPFDQVYAAFGAAIIIFLSMLAWSFILIFRMVNRFAPTNNLSEGLAEVAYQLEHEAPKVDLADGASPSA